MTTRRLMRELYRGYMEFFLSIKPGLLGPPLNYHRFVLAICFIVTGDGDNQAGVMERYQVYKDYCVKHAQPIDTFTFVARSIIGNPRAALLPERERLANLLDSCEAVEGSLPLVMN